MNNDSRVFGKKKKKKNLPFQEQAKKWVKNMEASRGLEIVDLQVSTFDHFP
jgi:site-specific recombinase XerC